MESDQRKGASISETLSGGRGPEGVKWPIQCVREDGCQFGNKMLMDFIFKYKGEIKTCSDK